MKKRLVRLLTLLLLVVAAAAVGYYGYTQYMAGQVAAASAAQARVQYVPVTRGTLSASVNATGSITPINTARVNWRVAGILREVNVKVGDVVKAGDVLARLDTTDLELSLATALTNLENAQIRYAQAAAGPTGEDRTIAKANLEKSASNLQKAQSDYDRVAWQPAIATSTQASALQQATLDYQIAQANYAKAMAGPTREDVALLQNTIKLNQIQLEQAKRNLANATLVAPIDGVIAAVSANPGEPVGNNSLMFNIIDLNVLRVDANVDETDMVKLSVGQPVFVTFDSLSGLRVPARVTAIAPNAQMQSGVVTYQIQMTLLQVDPRLRAGLTATANVIIEQRDNVVMVPNRAIKLGRNNLRTVLVQAEEGRLEKQVAVGMSNDQYTEITAGLTEGEQAVIVTTATNQPLAGGVGGGGGGMPGMGGGTMFIGR